MTSEEVKALYKRAQTGSQTPFGDIYAPIANVPATGFRGQVEGLAQPAVTFGRNYIPGIGQLTRIPEVLAQRHYIDLARKAGLYPKGQAMGLGQSLSRKGSKVLRREWDQFVKTVGKDKADDVIFRTFSRMRPGRKITGKMLPKLTKAFRSRALGGAFAMLDPALESVLYATGRKRIADRARAQGHSIGKHNPFLRKA